MSKLISILHRLIKRRVYGSRGAFPYHGTKVYFPPRSTSFRAACGQGTFEAQNVQILVALTRPGTACLDVGANIGLMAVPLLAQRGDCQVASFEPSPTVLPYLRRTRQESRFSERWKLVEKALSFEAGKAEFVVSEDELYDGLQDTGRSKVKARVEVPVSTLDEEWRQLGQPKVSTIKIDVEGAELDVLRGATECIRANRPSLLVEWFAENLAAYGRRPEAILDYAAEMDFDVLPVPSFVPIRNASDLELHMLNTYDLLLRPASA